MKTIFMKQADWQKWDAALRSGEYKQCASYLFDGVGYCCLGVLQQCLDGETEAVEPRSDDELPSLDWLESHGIRFTTMFGYVQRQPYLPAFGQFAATVNDDRVEGSHVCDFVTIADAIKEAVEFTDA